MALDWLLCAGSYEKTGSNHHVQVLQEYSNKAVDNNREYNKWTAAGRRPVLTVSNTNPTGNSTAGLLTAAKSSAAIMQAISY